MLDPQQVAQTEQRYAMRATERMATEAKIAAGDVLEADTPERVRLRLERKGIEPVMAARVASGEVAMAPAAVTPATASVINVLERIIGASNLIEANFLTAGARAARSICRIEIVGAGGLVLGYGTGVMISPRLVLTNNHVLESAEVAATSRAEFGYEEGDDETLLVPVAFGLEPDAFFLTDPHLDYTAVAVRSASQDGRALREYAWIPLVEQQGKVIKGEYVNIIQHPNGEPKQVALRENQIVDLLDDFLHYKTDTAPGSSGSPVFNDEWELVALHHSGVPAKDLQGNILAIDGSIWTQDMGEHRVKWVANEGARVSRIVRHMRDQALDDAQRRLLAEALDEQRGSPAPERRGEGPPAGSTAITPAAGKGEEDRAVTWTIPLVITVRMGAPTRDGQVTGDARLDGGQGEPAGAMAPEPQLAEALAALEQGRRRPYYERAADEAKRDAYYQGLSRRRSKAAFFGDISELLGRTHEPQLRYAPSRHVYPWVDLQPNGMLRSIYTAEEYDPGDFIREDFRVEQQRATRLRERMTREASMTAAQVQEALDVLEAQLPFNCEHVVPQSWFDKREPMRGDLHHLFACESRCNSFRRNTPYFEFPDFDEALRRGCGMAEGEKFEPSHGKGPVARATLYFLLRYPGEINRAVHEYDEDRLELLLDWHEQEPPTEYELHRNAAIFELTGNRNPLIDFPEWASEVDFTAGLGGPTRAGGRSR